jgi:molecular chaperone GrpE
MSESEADTPENESEAAAPQASAQDAGGTPAPAGEGDRIALLEAEIGGLKDQLLRALAETENVRRRSQRERLDTMKYAATALVKDLLAVSDNLRRAIESVPQEAAEDDERLKTLIDGVELTEKELLSVFERHHIVKLEPLGEKLDPHRHEAMYEVPDPSQPPGTVVQVIEPGYLLHDRLVRPARVGVAKSGPMPAAAAEAAAEADGDDADQPEPDAQSDAPA